MKIDPNELAIPVIDSLSSAMAALPSELSQ